MSQIRFAGYIHSIVGSVVMVSPNKDDQYKCNIDDFESVIPVPGFTGQFIFHVKRSMIGVEHYRRWLGMERIEKDRLEGIEMALLSLTKWIEPKTFTERESTPSTNDPEFAQYFTDQVK